MTRLTVRMLLAASILALLVSAPVLAQPGETGGEEGGTTEETAPPAPAFLPTGPATVENPTATDEADFGRPRVAIIPFVETYSADGVIVAAGAVGDILATELQKTGRFNVVAKKEDLKELIQNAQIEQSGLYDLESVPDLGKYKGAEIIMMGRISSAKMKGSDTTILGFGGGSEKASVRIDFRIVKAETGEVLYSESGEGSGSSGTSIHLGNYGGSDSTASAAGMFSGAIVSACQDFVAKVEATDIWPVRAVVKGTAGSKVVVDLGMNVGFYPGLQLDLRDVDVLMDDETGEILANDIGAIYGKLVLDEVQVDRSIGHVVSGGAAKKRTLAEVPKGITLTRTDESAAQHSNDERQTEKDKDKKAGKNKNKH